MYRNNSSVDYYFRERLQPRCGDQLLVCAKIRKDKERESNSNGTMSQLRDIRTA